MVDFKKLLGKQTLPKSLDPLEIFSSLDKESGKENLRPVQETVLREWYAKHRSQRDTFVKLHTGQGKTLSEGRPREPAPTFPTDKTLSWPCLTGRGMTRESKYSASFKNIRKVRIFSSFGTC